MNSASSKNDFRLLVGKRSRKSLFMASAYVFPGGTLEAGDFSSRWWSVFETSRIYKADLLSKLGNINGPRPPMITDPITVKKAKIDGSFLPPDIALRIAAIRETFEETGLFLTFNRKSISSQTPTSDLDQTDVDLTAWREKVRQDPIAFVDLCLETNCCPDVWSLYEWWNWLTPTSLGPKRFDTMFYVYCLERQPKVILDNSEITNSKWCTPTEILEEHVQNKVFLAPPQVYELSRIKNLTSFSSVKDFAEKRQKHGIERWLSVQANCKDGSLILLPGDDLYPKIPELIGSKPIPDFPQTLSEMREKAVKINRIESRGAISIAISNVTSCGHLIPVTYTQL
ncbi:Nucleoside diphosphate-linked moiety X motif 19-like protein [Dinothrombium tinctorium]|uniref:Nucleoside diphosphate-linked moiety X motif 19-like protein n=1 Tax=Dinothrombium tinctorium TaxID=1965070 RepID=A0A3S3PHT5_9ACAR|nr:Nucleoside diphosphate-linked moiety X motif 19-like protein [Dinothrombium tinctorium]